MKIIVDAFGGDNAPLAVLQGCKMAIDEYDVDIVLTGNKEIIEETAAENNISLDRMEIVEAQTVMPIEAEPTEIMKSYNNSSMAVGLKLLSTAGGDAFVSAGSTGALVVGGTLIVKRIKTIKRVAISALVPTLSKNGPYLLLDAGANHECRAEMLAQFGVMGSVYMEKIIGRERPKVALLNIGVEETKGLPPYVKAYGILKNSPLNFIGNIEGRDMPLGMCDVAVCDGFAGNIALKVTEGMGKSFSNTLKDIFTKTFANKISAAILLKDIKAIRGKMDYSETGGAPLLGLRKPVIKAHGSSNPLAFKNAIRQAKRCHESGMIDTMSAVLSQMDIKETED